MRSFEYGDEEISTKQLGIAILSMILGVGTLTFPRIIAKDTLSIDGMISIVIAGIFACFFAWLIGKLVARFPQQTFFHFTSTIVTKPIAYVLTLLLTVHFISIASFGTIVVSTITKLYLLNQTPTPVTSLFFLLLVLYAVAGSTAAILRINEMFVLIIVFFILFVQFMNIGFFEFEHIKPFFVTNWQNILKTTNDTYLYFTGFEIMFFYGAFLNKPNGMPKAAVIGIAVPFMLYLIIFLFTIGVLSNPVVANVIYPTLSIAKEVEVPGGFFERFESVFFTIMIMTIFNTTAMAFNVSILSLSSMFKRVKKATWLLGLSPLIYLLAMSAQNVVELHYLRLWFSYVGLFFTVIVPTLLFLIAKARKVKGL